AIARSDPRAIGRAMAGMSWKWATVAAVLNLIGVAIDAMRLRIIVGAEAQVSVWHVIQAQLMGIVGNVLFPFKLGEGARAYMLTRRGELSTSGAVKMVVADRIIDALVLPIFVVGASMLLPLPERVLRYRGWMLASAAVTSVAIVAVGRSVQRGHRHASRGGGAARCARVRGWWLVAVVASRCERDPGRCESDSGRCERDSGRCKQDAGRCKQDAGRCKQDPGRCKQD